MQVFSAYQVRLERDAKNSDTDIKFLHVESKVMSRFSTTHVRSEVRNLKNETQEIFFEAQLPAEAFISNFTMEIDGRLEIAEVKGKEEAARNYAKAKFRGRTAGLVAQKPRGTDIFRTSVNVEANGKVKFDLTYQEVLVRRHGVYKHVINILSTQGIEDVKIDVIISERGKITQLKVPKFAPKIAVKTNKELLALPDSSDASIKESESDGITTVKVSYTPSAGRLNSPMNGQLAVLYDVERTTEGGEIEVVDGFFVHFFAPPATFLDSVSADFVFVLDKSGSMKGRKFNQMQKAMQTILPQLREEDRFSLIYFDSVVSTWENTLRQADADNIDRALEFIDEKSSWGGTNIYGAILEAISILSNSSTEDAVERPAVIVFLTDGRPTAGEIEDPEEIKRAIRKRNKDKIKIHSLAFGPDANSTMLKQLSIENTGLYKKIFVASDAALQLDGFYSEISIPLFSNLNVTYLNSSVQTDTVIKNRNDDTLYEGSEIVLVGKLKEPNVTRLQGEISAKRSDGAPVSFRFGNECFHCCVRVCPNFCGPRRKCILPLPPPVPVIEVSPAELPPNTLGGLIERMWAYQSIKKKLMNAELNPGNGSQLKMEAKNLAIKYNFVTELTSLVIVEKEAEFVPTEGAEDSITLFSSSPRRRMPALLAGSRRKPKGVVPFSLPRRRKPGRVVPFSVASGRGMGPSPPYPRRNRTFVKSLAGPKGRNRARGSQRRRRLLTKRILQAKKLLRLRSPRTTAAKTMTTIAPSSATATKTPTSSATSTITTTTTNSTTSAITSNTTTTDTVTAIITTNTSSTAARRKTTTANIRPTTIRKNKCSLEILVIIDARPGSRIASKKSEIFSDFRSKLSKSGNIDGKLVLAYLTSDFGDVEIISFEQISTGQSFPTNGKTVNEMLQTLEKQKGDRHLIFIHGRQMIPQSLKKIIVSQNNFTIISALMRQDATSMVKMVDVLNLSVMNTVSEVDAEKLFEKVNC